jgi:peptidoglycan hydrolase-like protein with peptidoglycan-binding domain
VNLSRIAHFWNHTPPDESMTRTQPANPDLDSTIVLRHGGWPHLGRKWLILGAVAIALTGIVVGLMVELAPSQTSPTNTKLSGFTTALVAKRTLVQHDTASGTLGYTNVIDVAANAQGAITWLPLAGALIRPGQLLYRLAGQSTFLFNGSSPAVRDFAPGMTPGPDVLELKEALRDLGHDPTRELTLNDQFDFVTRAVIERWQQANKLPLTGTIPLGQIVFQPGARRVGPLQATVGQGVTTGELLFQASSVERIVTGSIDASLQSDLQLGAPVSVDLLDGTVTSGRITEIDRVAASSSQSQQQAATGSGSTSSTLGFQVTLSHASVAGDLDQAPVTIQVDHSKAVGVLSVPVTALLAIQGGGYGVQVIRNGVASLIPVTAGVYSDNGYVQISGDGIRQGERVVAAQ